MVSIFCAKFTNGLVGINLDGSKPIKSCEKSRMGFRFFEISILSALINCKLFSKFNKLSVKGLI